MRRRPLTSEALVSGRDANSAASDLSEVSANAPFVRRGWWPVTLHGGGGALSASPVTLPTSMVHTMMHHKNKQMMLKQNGKVKMSLMRHMVI